MLPELLMTEQTQVPNLAGVIDPSDLFKKNGFDYVTWARIANYLHTKANGWQCALEPNEQGQHVWTAPNGTGYLMLYFVSPEGRHTTSFPYAITDFKNKPRATKDITATEVCNSQRRGFAAAAAYFFGLGYELWAKLEVEESVSEQEKDSWTEPVEKTVTVPIQQQPSATAVKPDDQPTDDVIAAELPIDKDELDEIGAAIKSLSLSDKKTFDKFCTDYRKAWDLKANEQIFPQITENRHGQWCRTFLSNVSPK